MLCASVMRHLFIHGIEDHQEPGWQVQDPGVNWLGVEMEKGLNGIKLALKVLNEDYAKADKSHSSGDGAARASLVCWRSPGLTSPRV